MKVSADVGLLLSADEATALSYDEIQARLARAFDFDGFAWQEENGVEITENFRADGLERILYKCAACGEEGGMKGEGVTLTCSRCGKRYEMDTLGRLRAEEGETEFPHVPDWYRWERACVQREIGEGRYRMDEEVTIGVMVDYKAIYMIGDGRLVHSTDGFTLTGADGRLLCRQNPQASYGLYADYYWYEIGDMICIGGGERLFYCFPKGNCPVAKARMAAEELYKIERAKIRGGGRGQNDNQKESGA